MKLKFIFALFFSFWFAPIRLVIESETEGPLNSQDSENLFTLEPHPMDKRQKESADPTQERSILRIAKEGAGYNWITFPKLSSGIYPIEKLVGEEVSYPLGGTRVSRVSAHFDLKALRLLKAVCLAKNLLKKEKNSLTGCYPTSQLIHYLLAEGLLTPDLMAHVTISEKQPLIQAEFSKLVQKHLDPKVKVAHDRENIYISGELYFIVDFEKKFEGVALARGKLSIPAIIRATPTSTSYDKALFHQLTRPHLYTIPFNHHSIAFFKACLELSTVIKQLHNTCEPLEFDIENHAIPCIEDSLFAILRILGLADCHEPWMP